MKVWKYNRDEYRRLFYLNRFGELPYKDYFFFRTKFHLVDLLIDQRIYAYAGRYWFKILVNKWKCGFSVRSFTWAKKVAIFKKKQTMKKKKK